MTKETKGPKRPKRQPTGDYPVGYARPPAQHQFKKGQVQAGRQKPAAAAHSPSSQNDQAAIREARRKVELREGGSTIKISAYDASLRSLAVNGIKGSRLHAKLFLERADRAEERRQQEAAEWESAVYQLKEVWLDIVALHMERFGTMPRAPVPHPDDIRLDLETGKYFIDGPRNHGERDELESLVKEVKKLKQQAMFHRNRWLKDPRDDSNTFAMDLYMHCFEVRNNFLPRRYKIARIERVKAKLTAQHYSLTMYGIGPRPDEGAAA
jgi:hypothetical protein